MNEGKQYITDRLRRYYRACLAERLDPDFADAVYEAADGIESRDKIILEMDLNHFIFMHHVREKLDRWEDLKNGNTDH